MHRFFRFLENRSGTTSGPGDKGGHRWDAYEGLRRLWESSVPPDIPEPPDVDKAWQRLRHELANLDEGTHVARTARVWTVAGWWPGRVAIAGGALMTILFVFLLAPVVLGTSYRTGAEGRLTVALPDSSTVTLCENSSLTLERGLFGGLRRTSLHGQGFFSMKPQETPFTITTVIGSIRVVGTEFDVRCGREQLYVAVTRGTVAVSSSSSAPDNTVFVHKGEFVLCSRGGQPGAPGKSMTGGEPMWLSGSLAFRHADLHSVCDEISRQLGVRIELNNPSLDTITVTGLIRGNETRLILSALCELTGTNYRAENDGYVVY